MSNIDNLRPCVFWGDDGKEHKGYFHTWEQRSSGNVARMLALIETEDGLMVVKAPYLIKFTDRKGDV